MPPLSAVLDFGDVAAWGLIVATVVFGIGVRHLTMGGAVALATLAGLSAKSVLMPLT